MSFSNPIISSFSSTLIRRTIPFCSSTTSTTCATSTQFLLSPKTKPIWPLPRAIHDPPDQYQTWSPPEFSPPVPVHYDNPSAPPEMPRISTSPDVDPISIPPPEVNPYHPPLDPDPNSCPDFPVHPMKPPPVPDIPPPFPKPDAVQPQPQPPDIVPPLPKPTIIPPPPTGPGGPIIV